MTIIAKRKMPPNECHRMSKAVHHKLSSQSLINTKITKYVQLNLVISNYINSNFHLYRAPILVLAASHYKRRKNVKFIERGYIKVSAISSMQHHPDVSTTFVYIEQCPKSSRSASEMQYLGLSGRKTATS